MNYSTAVALGLYVVVGGAAYWYFIHKQSADAATVQDDIEPVSGGGSAVSTTSDFVDSAETLVASWKTVNSGSDWISSLHNAETQFGLPVDLLSRMAYQESHFQESIIRGTTASPAGALGILQMLPKYFSSVRAPTPFSDDDVNAQILEAAQQVLSLYNQFSDWSLALAGYNAGAGNVRKYSGVPPFPETQKYVAQISADVPSIGAVA